MATHDISSGTWMYHYSDGNDEDRITLIRDVIFESLKDPLVIWVARAITANCKSRDETCEIKSIYKAVKKGPIPLPVYNKEEKKVVEVIEAPALRFVDDVNYSDTYPTAGRILRWLGQGAAGEDCDGHTVLICSLLMAIGYQTGAIIASKDGISYVHIFPVVGVPKNDPVDWLPLETTVDQAKIGWMPPGSYGVRKFKIFAFQPGKMKGRVLK